MPLIPDPPFPKTQGDNIRSKDWNDAVVEIVRLDNAKANRAGAETFAGPLTIAGSVGIGTSTPAAVLDVAGTTWQSHLRLTNVSDAGAGPGIFFNSAARDWALIATHGGASAGPGKFTIYDATVGQYRLVIDAAGNVGMGVDAPAENLHVAGRVRAGDFTLGPWPANAAYQMLGASTLDHTQQGNYALLQSAGGGDLGTTFVNSPQSIRLRINNGDRAVIDNDGSLTIGLVGNPIKFTSGWSGFADSTNNHAEIANDIGGYKTLMIVGNKSGGLGRRVSVWDRLEVNGQLIVTSNHTIKLGVPSGPYGNDGIRGEPNLWLDSAGTVFIKQGFSARGMDVAERFPMQDAVRGGQVVVYDESAGVVRACSSAYDATAVGIVSEAPAFLLGLGGGEAPVALCGRVPCWVDADIAPIAAGDLLVTSATPGHAQKLVDADRAAGRVIGKALESLASGRARILAFVLAA